MKCKQLLTAAIAFFLIYSIPSCSKSSSGGSGGGGGGGGTTPTIRISSNSFSPASLSVKVNTTINITNNDPVTHSATSDDMTTFDREVGAGATVTYNCPTVGTFPYHCKFHAGMAGTLTVTP